MNPLTFSVPGIFLDRNFSNPPSSRIKTGFASITFSSEGVDDQRGILNLGKQFGMFHCAFESLDYYLFACTFCLSDCLSVGFKFLVVVFSLNSYSLLYSGFR